MAQSTGKVATVCGRFYAMDRDKRWERVKEAYDMLVDAKGNYATSATEAIQASYDADVTDEFIRPVVITTAEGQPLTKVQEGDAVIFFNFRNDRARELTAVLTQQDMPEAGMHTLPLYFCCYWCRIRACRTSSNIQYISTFGNEFFDSSKYLIFR